MKKILFASTALVASAGIAAAAEVDFSGAGRYGLRLLTVLTGQQSALQLFRLR